MFPSLKMLAVAALLWPGIAGAATVTVSYATFAPSDVGMALTARDSFLGGGTIVGEDFESFLACPASGCASGTVSTALGSFTGIGQIYSKGGSQVTPKDEIVVRSATPKPFGRTNMTPGGANWLDSNDREGISWSVGIPGSSSISKIAFLLSDLDDVGSVLFGLTVTGANLPATTVTRTGPAKLADGSLTLVTLLFDTPTSNLTIDMVNGAGDGFGIDGVRVALTPVPLPAGGLLLVGAIGALAALRRRRA